MKGFHITPDSRSVNQEIDEIITQLSQRVIDSDNAKEMITRLLKSKKAGGSNLNDSLDTDARNYGRNLVPDNHSSD